MAGSTEVETLVRALADLGFSQYESQCYVGLMGREPQTGYRVAKTTGVPQPKVYETLRKLVGRGVVHEIAGDPTLFSAIGPDDLFASLEDGFERRLAQARESARHVAGEDVQHQLEQVERFDDRDSVLAAALQCVDAAQRRVYLSAGSTELTALRPAVEAATARGVDVVALVFGRRGFDVPGVRVFRHASTEGAVIRRHQSRHVALVADSQLTVTAFAADGQRWAGIRTRSEPIIAAVKGFIRHDIDLQRVYADFGPQLVEAYGAGLQQLESYRQDQAAEAGLETARAASGSQRRSG